jgi:hypothetical protein
VPEPVAQDVEVGLEGVVAEGLGVGEQHFDGQQPGGVVHGGAS